MSLHFQFHIFNSKFRNELGNIYLDSYLVGSFSATDPTEYTEVQRQIINSLKNSLQISKLSLYYKQQYHGKL